MTDTPQPLGSEFGLPFVPQEVINQLLQGDANQPGFVAAEWGELSKANPHLRDLVTLIAVAEAPHDMAARQRSINHSMLLLEAVERGFEVENLHKLMSGQLSEMERAELVSSLVTALEQPPEPVPEPVPAAVESRPRRLVFSKLRTAFSGLLRSRGPVAT